MRPSPIFAALLLTLAVLLLVPGAASAKSFFSDTGSITIPASGQASPYPSTITVSNVRAPIADVDVTLFKFGHTRPADVDILLVSPAGTQVNIMSDACGDGDIEDFTWTLRSTAQDRLPATSDCGGSGYQPGNYQGFNDAWPGVTLGTVQTSLDALKGENPDGVWRLYVVDDTTGEAGDIEGGWVLGIDTTPVDTLVPATGTGGKASNYPAVRTISGKTGVVRDVNVTLEGVYHDFPDDLDVLLVGPRGQKVVLASDACGATPVGATHWIWDSAPGVEKMPDAPATGECGGRGTRTFAPTDYEPGETWPAPAPPGPYGNSLSDFNFVDPNGDWQLYVNDDFAGGPGFLANRFDVQVTTGNPAGVAFTETAIRLPEGTAHVLTLKRSGTTPLGPGTIAVRTRAVSATDDDISPLTTPVSFAAGEAEKTIAIAALTDGVAEPDETLSLVLAGGTGDAQPATDASVAITIPGQPAEPQDTGTGGGGTETGTGGGPVVVRDTTKPVVSVVPSKRLGRDGSVKVRVRCSEECTGSVTVASTKRLRVSRAAKPRKLTLGTGTFRLPRAGSTNVKVKLTASGRAAVRFARRVAIKAAATATDPAANRGVGRAKATLRR